MFVVQSEREASEQTLANTAKTHDRMKNEQRGWLHVCFVVLHPLTHSLSVSILQAEASRTVPDCTARCKERTHVCFQPFSGIHCIYNYQPFYYPHDHRRQVERALDKMAEIRQEIGEKQCTYVAYE